jgi:hypothetical protein
MLAALSTLEPPLIDDTKISKLQLHKSFMEPSNEYLITTTPSFIVLRTFLEQ